MLKISVAVFCFAVLGVAQAVFDGPGITVDAGAALMHRAPIFRTPGITASGDVILEASVDSIGEVMDAHVVSGPLELRRDALESVLQWHYSTHPSLPPTVRVTVHFAQLSAVPQGVAGSIGSIGSSSGAPVTIGKIEIVGVTPEVEQLVRDRIPAHIGDQITPDLVGRTLAASRQIDEHFQIGTRFAFEGQFSEARGTLRISISSDGDRPLPPAMSLGPVPTPSAAGRIAVDQDAQAANLVTKINPTYPPLAKQARIQGVVHLSAIIGTDGAVENLQVVSGHPLLVPSAIEAVKQWVYKPTLRDGKPVEVATGIAVNFTLLD